MGCVVSEGKENLVGCLEEDIVVPGDAVHALTDLITKQPLLSNASFALLSALMFEENKGVVIQNVNEALTNDTGPDSAVFDLSPNVIQYICLCFVTINSVRSDIHLLLHHPSPLRLAAVCSLLKTEQWPTHQAPLPRPSSVPTMSRMLLQLRARRSSLASTTLSSTRLCQFGVSSFVYDRNGDLPLHLAASSGQSSIIRMWLDGMLTAPCLMERNRSLRKHFDDQNAEAIILDSDEVDEMALKEIEVGVASFVPIRLAHSDVTTAPTFLLPDPLHRF
ncbi:hypothetical protein BLNAU_432 [Blattamonas nauphoetae]|uniref:Ankyrin repeat protein n=1 Tax=Blattamonas nauphoetae TaxID=2049346 RepID=A0ABQ9YL76_9EUKA|nr:hypothetical protein BLNAU_432 [Blattamonas nauphoetae]